MDWGTPQSFFDALDAEFHFTQDVCADDSNFKVPFYWTPADDALNIDWAREAAAEMADDFSAPLHPPVCWMNPPYGRYITEKWVQKAWDEKQKGVTTVCLLPARTETLWWAIFWDHDKHRPRDPHDEVRFVKGRITFEGAGAPAPFPSAVIVLRGKR